jgi:hypothetical protein
MTSPPGFPLELSRMALHSESCASRSNWQSRIHSDTPFKTSCCRYSDAIKHLISKFGVMEALTSRDQIGFSLIHYIAAGSAFGLSDEEDVELLCVWLRSLWDNEVGKATSSPSLGLEFHRYQEQLNIWSLGSVSPLSLNDLNTGPPPHPLSLLLSGAPSSPTRTPPVATPSSSSSSTINAYLTSMNTEETQNAFIQVADSLKNLPPLSIAISCNSITSIRALILHLSASPFLVSSPSSTAKEYYRTPLMCGIRLNGFDSIQATFSAFMDRWEDRLRKDGLFVRESASEQESQEQTKKSLVLLQPGKANAN